MTATFTGWMRGGRSPRTDASMPSPVPVRSSRARAVAASSGSAASRSAHVGRAVAARAGVGPPALEAGPAGGWVALTGTPGR